MSLYHTYIYVNNIYRMKLETSILQINKQLNIFLQLSPDSCHWKHCDISTATSNSSGGIEIPHVCLNITQKHIIRTNQKKVCQPIREPLRQPIPELITERENLCNKRFTQSTWKTQVGKESKSVDLEKEDAMNRARWRVGVGEIAVRVV